METLWLRGMSPFFSTPYEYNKIEGQMKNLLLVDPVKMVSMTILRNENLKKYLGET